MKKSIFKDGTIAYGVDYSHRPDIQEVVDITHEQYIEETKPPVIEEPITEEELETAEDTSDENEESEEEEQE